MKAVRWLVLDAVKSKEVLNLLLEQNMPQFTLNETLMAVCRNGVRAAECCVKLLLDNSAEVNYRDLANSDNLTPPSGCHTWNIISIGQVTPRERCRHKCR